MKLPLLFFLALSYLLGILAIPYLKFSLLFLTSATLILLFALMFLYKKTILSLLVLLISFLILGMLMANLVGLRLERSLLAKWVGKDRVIVSGTVYSEPKTKGKNTSFDFKVNNLEVGAKRWITNEKVRVDFKGKDRLPDLTLGKKLVLSGKLCLPTSSPGYRMYLYHRRIKVILYADVLKPASSQKRGFFGDVVETSRQRIKEDCQRFIKGDLAGLMAGIILGDTSDISGKLQEDFKITGLTHILAVSGLNVGMLLAVALYLLRFLRCRPAIQVFMSVVFLVFYSAITHSEPSVIRASLMAAIGLCGWFLGRKKDMLSALSGAALLLLIYDPFLVYSVSFQLSFAATLAIILIYPVLELRLEEIKVPVWLRGAASVSLAAQLGVVPILVYYFNQISVISLMANLLIVPATAPVLAIGMGGWVIGFISTHLSQFIYLLNIPLLKYMVETARLLAQVPKAALDLPSPSLAAISGYYLTLGVGVYALSLKKKSWDRRVVLLLLVLSAVFIWSQVIIGGVPAKFEVTFMDVGQGDSALIRTPEGANILIDGGESLSVLHKALLKRGVGRIDLLVLSHPHSDHVGGLTSVVKRMKVGLILDSGQIHTSPLYKEFLEEIKERNIPYKIVRRGMIFQIAKDVRIEILHPPSKFITGTVSDLNNNSIVARISYSNISFLFPGDLELEGQKNIISYAKNLESDVFKIPHHGSTGGIYPLFLDAVKPGIAVISVGKNNPFGHPARHTLKHLESLGIRTYRTDEEGDVTIVCDGKKLEVK